MDCFGVHGSAVETVVEFFLVSCHWLLWEQGASIGLCRWGNAKPKDRRRAGLIFAVLGSGYAKW